MHKKLSEFFLTSPPPDTLFRLQYVRDDNVPVLNRYIIGCKTVNIFTERQCNTSSIWNSCIHVCILCVWSYVWAIVTMIQYSNTVPSRCICIGCGCLKEKDRIRCSLVENKYVLTFAAVVVVVVVLPKHSQTDIFEKCLFWLVCNE
jgi:hypothetical protein